MTTTLIKNAEWAVAWDEAAAPSRDYRGRSAQEIAPLSPPQGG